MEFRKFSKHKMYQIETDEGLFFKWVGAGGWFVKFFYGADYVFEDGEAPVMDKTQIDWLDQKLNEILESE